MPEYNFTNATPDVFFAIPNVTGAIDLVIYESEDYFVLGRMAIAMEN